MSANELGGRVTFCGVSPTITKTFGILGLLDLTEVYDTEEDAVALIKKSA